MKKILLAILILLGLSVSAKGQGTQVVTVSSDPATCTTGMIYYNSTSQALKTCGPANTWVSTSSIPLVTANPTTCTTGQTFFNTVTGQFLLCIATNTVTTASGSIATTVDVLQFGVKADAKVCFDGTVTSGSPNIASAGQCQWTAADVGKKIFVTTLCSATICGYSQGFGSTTILPSTQLTVARIATVTDATHVVTDCTAPGNCVSPNASSSGTAGFAVVVYGDDDTTALNNAFAALANNNGKGCPTLLLPQGLMFFNAALFTTLPSLATNSCSSPNVSNGSGIKNLGQGIGNSSFAVRGMGQSSSLLVPTPDFDPTTCTGPNGLGTSCMFGMLSPVLQDFGVWGAGQSLLASGSALNGKTLFNCNACVMLNVNLSQWAARVTGNTGLAFGGGAGFAYATNLYTDDFGGGSGGVLTSGSANQISNSTLGFSSNTLSVAGGSAIQTSNVVFYGPTPWGVPAIDVSGTWFSSNDRIDTSLSGANIEDITVRNGGIAYIKNFNNLDPFAGDKGVSVLSGGLADLSGYKAASAHTLAGTVAGTLYDNNRNVFNGPINVTGTLVAEGHSAKGACTGVATASQTLGLYPLGGTTTTCTSTTPNTSPIVIQGSRTLRGLTVTATAGGVNASSGVVTVLKNGSATTLTCTIGTGTSCADSTHTVSAVDGDLISIQFTTQVAETLAGVKAITSWE